MRTILPLFLSTTSPERLMTELRSTIRPNSGVLKTNIFNGNGLDINCWTGESTKSLQEIYPDICFYGVDKNENAIDVAKKRYSEKFFRAIDLEKSTDTFEDYFQIIHISNYNDVRKILSSAFPMLEDDGFIILRYKDQDERMLKKLFEKNHHIPKRNDRYENMYLFSDRKTAIFFK